jgi:hypothetical protein
VTHKEILCLMFGFGLGVIIALGSASIFLIAQSP